MSRSRLAPLARATGLTLLLAHAAAQAQHAHAADTGADAAAARCACPASAAAVPMADAAATQPDTAMHGAMDHAAMGHAAHVPAMQGAPATQTTAEHADAMSHAHMDHATMDHAAAPASQGDHREHAHSAHDGMHHDGMDHAMPSAPSPTATACHCPASANTPLPREPIPPITAADRAAAFPVLRDHGMAHGASRTGYLLVDRLEGWDNAHGSGQAWEARGWYGGDIDRLWLRSDGEREGGRTTASSLELAYGRAISPWWDVLIGGRQTFAPGHARTSAAFGVQGMAPYKFEVSAMLYVGEGGHASLHLEGEYDVLLTNRLILQPRLEAELAARDDPAHRTGSGLTTVEGGLRLRYEVTRRFAPYVGVEHVRSFGETADQRRAAGEAMRETRWVAGLRFWF
ncbi:copper resistance protein B [Xanthomonas rydalmerensis]|uniref:Copper resistance protein B n=1 Tax=Xanthomonas rydalmerensis TaxID=3046274 RepID=A0ABZ0JKM0_9XANT|nr:copper resistance protein B [Xanthomonas sp. DM-2023]WOS40341.1 copper resistance protein B [Xanthomonas sp. DM-2023]WOS44525.1 copper resistance protein B [Xanthomonas sp. DM-2023]WOS48705.1 copper resistance protein B [Xanthomonas sp. DM-2023]WOS52885.1 copper resistance protein B [Xanthomonas sp. DM-2023]WOS57069.1 copper resistance protein B [Xanthomonas sp. DM-2023]